MGLDELEKYPDASEGSETVVKLIPKMVFDGKCDHKYVDDYLDNDGNQHCQCQFCPMGRLYNSKEAHLVGGKIVYLKEK
jgi:hypothetical protein